MLDTANQLDIPVEDACGIFSLMGKALLDTTKIQGHKVLVSTLEEDELIIHGVGWIRVHQLCWSRWPAPWTHMCHSAKLSTKTPALYTLVF